MLIKPSPLGATLVGSLHALAAFAVVVALPPAAAAICLAGVVLSATVHVARALQHSRACVHELTLHPDGRAAWCDGSGEWHLASRVHGAALAPWLAVIGLCDASGRVWPLVLACDAADAEALRALRVWLRWRAQPGNPAPAA